MTQRSLGTPYNFRLNPEDDLLFQHLLSTVTPAQLDTLKELDREGREGWRNHSGRTPSPRSLITRHAMRKGLQALALELAPPPLTEEQERLTSELHSLLDSLEDDSRIEFALEHQDH